MFSATFNTTGNQTITATDTANSSITGTSPPITVTLIPTPVFNITKTHAGKLHTGANGNLPLLVCNGVGAGPSTGSTGPVTVTDTAPLAITLVSMNGMGWTCPPSGNTCTRSDSLPPGQCYGTITVTVNINPTATSPQVNMATVAGGGSPTATAMDLDDYQPGRGGDDHTRTCGGSKPRRHIRVSGGSLNTRFEQHDRHSQRQ